MTNLLPQSEQLTIQKEYKYRRAVVFVLMFVGAVLMSAGFLLPSLILSNIKLETIGSEAKKARVENEEQSKVNSSTVVLKETEEKLALLKSDDEERSVVSAISLITKNKSPNIRIKEISYESGEMGRIVITGISKDRQSLTDFLNQMQTIAVFKSVDLPVSNFAKDKDINFSMQITGTF